MTYELLFLTDEKRDCFLCSNTLVREVTGSCVFLRDVRRQGDCTMSI